MNINTVNNVGWAGRMSLCLGPILLLIACSGALADPVAPNRRTTWQGNVGVEGGIPARTTIYRTLTSANTAADINNAIATCPAGQVVQLQDGVYNLTSAILIGQNNVTLRGQGSNTVLHFTGTIGGNGYITFSGPNQNLIWGANNQGTVNGSANWTGGYAQGSTNITLSSVSGLSVGQVICLDQMNDNIDVSSQGLDGFCNYCGRGGGRSQEQWVKVTAISGSTVSITPPIHMPNWQSSLNPQAWWVTGFVFNSGVESLNVDGSGGSLGGGLYPANIYMNGTWNCWVSNVWSEMGQIAHLVPYGGGRLTIQHCWFQGSKSSASMSYGVYPLYITGMLVENNIFNGVDAPMIPSTGISGCTFAYNYVTNVLFTNPSSWMDASIMTHGAANCMNLYEGNFVTQWDKDLFHGSSAYETLYRCRVTGTQSGKSGNRICVIVWPTNHYMNVVGNILGTPGVNTAYSGFLGGSWPDPAIYNVGFGRSGSIPAASDPMTMQTFYMHGNYDTANNAIIWAATNADHTLPPSLYLSSRPAWFGGAWPPFDPANGAAVASASEGYTNIPAGFRFIYGVDPATGPVNLPPTAKGAATPQRGAAPLAVSFSSAGSSDPEGTALAYTWTFGDGATSTAANPTHTYSAAGSYIANLSVSDGTNSASSTNIPIVVTVAGSNYPPVAVAAASVTGGVAPLTVNFTGTNSYDPDGGTLLYSWNFGDGSPVSTTANASHTYNSSGVYTAQLTVSDGTNSVAASPINIVVGAAASGLVAAYGFEEGSGSTVGDTSGNNNAGAINGATWTASGRFGKALSFNSSAMVTINDAASLHLSSGLTLEAWVRPTTLSSSWTDIIFKSGDNYFLMGSTPQSQLPDLGGTFAAANVYGTNTLPLNTWTHIAGTYDGTTMRFYMNGVEVANLPQTGTIPSSTGNLFIGGDSANGQFWNGLIDEVRVYNRALNAGEIFHDMGTPIIGTAGKPPAPQNIHVVINP